MTENDKTTQQSETVRSAPPPPPPPKPKPSPPPSGAAGGESDEDLRECVPMDEPLDDGAEDADEEDKSRVDKLRELLEDAETVEIVASNGEYEIPGMSYEVHGDHPWEVTRAGLKLNIAGDWLVHGPGMGDTQAGGAIVGYGLFIDDEQVAWRDRGGELPLRPGVTYNLKDDVIF